MSKYIFIKTVNRVCGKRCPNIFILGLKNRLVWSVFRYRRRYVLSIIRDCTRSLFAFCIYLPAFKFVDSTIHSSRPSTLGLAVKNKRSGWVTSKGAVKLVLKKPGLPLQ